MRNFSVKLVTLLALFCILLTACDFNNNDEAVKQAVESALAEERAKQAEEKAKQAELDAIKYANEQQIEARVKEEVQKELQKHQQVQKQQLPKEASLTPAKKVVTKTQNIGYIMTQNDGYVYLRDAPVADARKLRKLNDRVVIIVLECLGYEYRGDVDLGNEGSWCKVQTEDGLMGYVFNSYIRSGTP